MARNLRLALLHKCSELPRDELDHGRLFSVLYGQAWLMMGDHNDPSLTSFLEDVKVRACRA